MKTLEIAGNEIEREVKNASKCNVIYESLFKIVSNTSID